MTLSYLAKYGLIAACIATLVGSSFSEEESSMVKMCLFYQNAAGHARTDPILNQGCASDHVHTFYGKYFEGPMLCRKVRSTFLLPSPPRMGACMNHPTEQFTYSITLLDHEESLLGSHQC